jgi:23S rRNA pseudouridine2605 synthase
MEERLQKYLSRCGVSSRRAAEQMIEAGRVTVNGLPAQLGQRVDPARDTVDVDGKTVTAEPEKVYLMLNKPRGFVTTLSDEKGRRTVRELVADCGQRVYPVGRLDMDSEGLLLLTNDGEWTNRMTHPSHEVDKTYLVWVTGASADAAEQLARPMELDGYRLRPAKVREVTRTPAYALLEMTIHEGRNRQIRRMCEQCGMTVTRLRRISEGPLQLGNLETGKWRYLTEKEQKLLGIL